MERKKKKVVGGCSCVVAVGVHSRKNRCKTYCSSIFDTIPDATCLKKDTDADDTKAFVKIKN